MSVDVQLQKFEAGDAGVADAAKILGLLRPHFAGQPESGHVRVRTSDGGAQLQNLDAVENGFNVHAARGAAIWELVVRVARAAELVMFPVGGPTVVADEAHLDALPDELKEDYRVVRSGAELREIVEALE